VNEKDLELLLDSAEAILSIFGVSRLLSGFERKKTHELWHEVYQQHEKDIEKQKQSYKM
jgi:hypothetical protein